jgi:hypothetical protein
MELDNRITEQVYDMLTHELMEAQKRYGVKFKAD